MGSPVATKRLGTSGKGSTLPIDYTKMVQSVLTAHFEAGLSALMVSLPEVSFAASGNVFPDEIVLSVSLLSPNELPATTVHCSSSYDPKASSPNAEELLGLCLDAIGSVWEEVFKKPELLQDGNAVRMSLADLQETLPELPLTWTETQLEKRSLHLLIDKSNPYLDSMADDWLTKNDPQTSALEENEQRATQELFVTGEKAKKNKASPFH